MSSDVDARAMALACDRARRARLCIGSSSSLTPACVGEPFELPLHADGGASPYVWQVTAGSLPSGLFLAASTGLISGTPTAVGSSSFTVSVTDANGSFQVKAMTLRVLEIDQTTIPAAEAGIPYSTTLTASGEVAPVLWSISGGDDLPSGLSLDPQTGVLSGTPAESGTFTFTVLLQDAVGSASVTPGFCERTLTLVVTGILGYWTFDNITGSAGSSVIQDESPNNFDLGSDQLASVAGKVNNAAAIDNASAFTGVTSFNTPSQGFTVAGWLKLPIDTGNFGPLWVVRRLAPTSFIFALQYNFGGTISLVGATNNVTKTYPDDGQWHFIRCWYDGTSLKMQIDNGTIGQAVQGIVDSAVDFTIGFAATFASDRTYDETGFWPRVLTDDEAADLWNSGAGRTWPDVPP